MQEIHSSLLPYFQNDLYSFTFHSFNKYMLSAYSVHVLDLGSDEQDTYL